METRSHLQKKAYNNNIPSSKQMKNGVVGLFISSYGASVLVIWEGYKSPHLYHKSFIRAVIARDKKIFRKNKTTYIAKV